MATYWRNLRHKINKEVKPEVKKERKNETKEVKILLLGATETGKSTLLKQLRIIHGQDYTEEEKMDHRKYVYQNILKAIQLIIGAMDQLKIPYTVNGNSDKGARFLKDMECEKVVVLYTKFKQIYLDPIKSLWQDEGVQECYQRRAEFYPEGPLLDSIDYFMTHIDRIALPDYEMTHQDSLQTRIPRDTTEGAIEVNFEDDEMKYKVVEVGGGKAIKSKLAHIFEDLNSIIFMMSLGNYDQPHRMEESLALFKTTMTSAWLKNATVIVIMNKKDLFAEKLKRGNFVSFYRDYNGSGTDAVKTREFILKKFLDLNPNPQKTIYSHPTTLSVTEQVGFVLAAIKDSILQRNAEEYKLV